jgi:hypothetical protein
MFVTSNSFGGDLKTAGGSTDTGIDGGDRLCTLAAQAAELGGTWKAWLSDSRTDAIDRIAGEGPWYLVDGTTKVFNNKANLVTGPIAPIDQDEQGRSLPSVAAWTGTLDSGRTSGFHCRDWTFCGGDDSSGPGAVGTVGDPTLTPNFNYGVSWTSLRTFSTTANLMCFEQ